MEMPEKLLIARPEGPPSGRDPESFTGQLLDDRDATQQGSWTEGTGLKGYIGYGYIYAPADSQSQIDFELTTQKKGRYEVLLAYQSHENRGKTVLVTLTTKGKTDERRINMTQKPPIDDGFTSLGVVDRTRVTSARFASRPRRQEVMCMPTRSGFDRSRTDGASLVCHLA